MSALSPAPWAHCCSANRLNSKVYAQLSPLSLEYGRTNQCQRTASGAPAHSTSVRASLFVPVEDGVDPVGAARINPQRKTKPPSIAHVLENHHGRSTGLVRPSASDHLGEKRSEASATDCIGAGPSAAAPPGSHLVGPSHPARPAAVHQRTVCDRHHHPSVTLSDNNIASHLSPDVNVLSGEGPASTGPNLAAYLEPPLQDSKGPSGNEVPGTAPHYRQSDRQWNTTGLIVLYVAYVVFSGALLCCTSDK